MSNTYISALESGRKPAPPRAIVTALAGCLGAEAGVLWNLARSEREDRLRERINGVPTSQRLRRANTVSRDTPESRLPPELDDALESLGNLASDPQQRKSLAKALEALAAALRKKD